MCGTESRSVSLSLWAPSFICIMSWWWLNCKYAMTHPPLICNICLFSLFSLIFRQCFVQSQGIAYWMNQTLCLFWSPRYFIYRGKSTLTPLKSLHDLSTPLSAPSLPHLNCDTEQHRCEFLSSVNLLRAFIFHSCHGLTIMPKLQHGRPCCCYIYYSLLSIKDGQH